MIFYIIHYIIELIFSILCMPESNQYTLEQRLEENELDIEELKVSYYYIGIMTYNMVQDF